MKKDHIRDYATAAFRMWAARGCPTRKLEKESIKKRALSRARYADPQKATAYAAAEVKKREAELADIQACCETFDALTVAGKDYIAAAVKAVYMCEPYRTPRRGELASRALNFAIECPASERQVYRWLREGRELFAIKRNLRLSDEE